MRSHTTKMTETERNKIDPADGERLAQDLKKIRESKNISLDDLRNLTMIPLNLLRDFEVNALLGNPLFNQVYLRSLVKTYATATGIDPLLALESLESATIGMYHGELSQRYLGNESVAKVQSSRGPKKVVDSTTRSSDRLNEEEGQEQSPIVVPLDAKTERPNESPVDVPTDAKKEGPGERTEADRSNSSTRRAARRVHQPKTISKELTTDGQGTGEGKPGQSKSARRRSNRRNKKANTRNSAPTSSADASAATRELFETPDESSSVPKTSPAPKATVTKASVEPPVDRAEGSSGTKSISPKSSDERSSSLANISQNSGHNRGQKPTASPAPRTADSPSKVRSGPTLVLPRSSLFTIVSSLAVIVLLVAVSFILWRSFSDSSQSAALVSGDADNSSPERVLTPQESTAVVTQQIIVPEVGETIVLDVFARGGNLRPIRVRVDRDLRRPYWIDKDSVRTFQFKDQIVLEESIELVSLSIGGFDYPLELNPGNRVVISRDQVKTFYSSLASR